MFPPLQKNLQEEGVGEPRSPNLSANLCVLYAAAIPVTVLVVVTFTKLKEWGWNGWMLSSMVCRNRLSCVVLRGCPKQWTLMKLGLPWSYLAEVQLVIRSCN